MASVKQHPVGKPVVVVTGSSNGIGKACCALLSQQGYEVCGLDLDASDLCFDLAQRDLRQQAVTAIVERYPQGLHGLICSAGLGPHSPDLGTVAKVNYFGTTELIEHLLPSLEKQRGYAVVVASNSASLSSLNQQYQDLLLAANEAAALDLVRGLDGHTVYAGSKRALISWMKKIAPKAIKKAVNINAVAPGVTKTQLTDGVFKDAVFGDSMRRFSESIPAGYVATPEMIAGVIAFLVSPAAEYVSGSTLFVDGGHDAALRPEGL